MLTLQLMYLQCYLYMHTMFLKCKKYYLCADSDIRKKAIFFEVELNSLSNSRMQKFNTILNLTMELCNHTITYVMRCAIWHHLYNLKNVKHTHAPKVALLHGCFSRFLNCTNDTKLSKAS